MAEAKRFCEKCKRVLNQEEFYQSNNVDKYPDGYLNICKKCLTMHVDNFVPETYTWILQEIDVPYIPDEWNKLLARYGRDRSKLTGTTILGRYLAKMKLRQFKDFRWADNEFLQEMANSRIKETMERQGYSAAQITEVISTASINVPKGEVEIPDFEVEDPIAILQAQNNNPFGGPSLAKSNFDFADDEDDIDIFGSGPSAPPVMMGGGGGVSAEMMQPTSLFDDEDDADLELTDDDKKYLRLKWGRTYRPSEWVQLEQLYQEMTQSYDIQSAGDINTLKLMCKTSLKANQLLDLGDVDGAQKMAKVYDGMMKSGKWTAAQNKTAENEFVDSIGELVAICEKDGFIPRFYVDGPQDKVDRVLQDMQIFTRQLVTEELGLGNLIENSIKNLEKEKASIEAAANSEIDERSEEDKMFDYDNADKLLSLDDYKEFNEFEEEWEEEAKAVYANQEAD